MMFAIGCSVAASLIVAGCVLYVGVYGGLHGSLSSSKVGEIVHFTYEQPLEGTAERYLAKVLDVRKLTDAQIEKLNRRSRYRSDDPSFIRTSHLVTCQSMDGTVRNFYAERTRNLRRPLFGKQLFKVPRLASLIL